MDDALESLGSLAISAFPVDKLLSGVLEMWSPMKAGWPSLEAETDTDNFERADFKHNQKMEALGFSESWQLIVDRETSRDLSKGESKSPREGEIVQSESQKASTENSNDELVQVQSEERSSTFEDISKCLWTMNRFSKRWQPLLLKERFEAETILTATLELISIQHQLVELYNQSSECSCSSMEQPLVLRKGFFRENLLLEVITKIFSGHSCKKTEEESESESNLNEKAESSVKQDSREVVQINLEERSENQSCLTSSEAQTPAKQRAQDITRIVDRFAPTVKIFFEMTSKLKLKEQAVLEASPGSAKQSKSARNTAKKKLRKLSIQKQDASICLGLEGVR